MVMEKENDNTSELEKEEKTIKDEDISKNEQKEDHSLEDKLSDIEEKLIRSYAELENQRRRYEKEKDEAYEFGGMALAKECLNLTDNLERSKLSIINDQSLEKKNKDKMIEHLDIIYKDVISIFKKNQIEEISALGEKLDPNKHQAMLEVEDEDKEQGIVVQEVQKGFTLKGRLLRPSLVGVSKKTLKNEEKQQKKEKN
tara:strand:- start:637 stop:1233 length:597 start_codon:yes stop_codon:yes gene_type:complete